MLTRQNVNSAIPIRSKPVGLPPCSQRYPRRSLPAPPANEKLESRKIEGRGLGRRKEALVEGQPGRPIG